MAKADIRTCYTSRKRNGIRLYNSLVRKVEVERGREKKESVRNAVSLTNTSLLGSLQSTMLVVMSAWTKV